MVMVPSDLGSAALVAVAGRGSSRVRRSPVKPVIGPATGAGPMGPAGAGGPAGPGPAASGAGWPHPPSATRPASRTTASRIDMSGCSQNLPLAGNLPDAYASAGVHLSSRDSPNAPGHGRDGR